MNHLKSGYFRLNTKMFMKYLSSDKLFKSNSRLNVISLIDAYCLSTPISFFPPHSTNNTYMNALMLNITFIERSKAYGAL